MKKFFLVIFILLDLAAIAGSAVFLISRIKGVGLPSPVQRYLPPAVNAAVASIPKPAVVISTATPSSAPAASATSVPSTTGRARRILFSYRNSKVKKVMIRADFTGWKEEPMQRDPSSVWKYTATLEPGEYAYVFSVDDKKPIKDPFNKRTKKVGTTFVSSIVVEAPPAAPH